MTGFLLGLLYVVGYIFIGVLVNAITQCKGNSGPSYDEGEHGLFICFWPFVVGVAAALFIVKFPIKASRYLADRCYYGKEG